MTELFKTMRKRRERSERRKSVTVAPFSQLSFFPHFSRYKQMDSGGQEKELLGVWRGVHCGLLIFKLALIYPQGTPDCLHCSIKSGPRKRSKEGDQIDIKGEGMIGKIKNQKKTIFDWQFLLVRPDLYRSVFCGVHQIWVWWTGAQRDHSKGIFPHCERIFFFDASN